MTEAIDHVIEKVKSSIASIAEKAYIRFAAPTKAAVCLTKGRYKKLARSGSDEFTHLRRRADQLSEYIFEFEPVGGAGFERMEISDSTKEMGWLPGFAEYAVSLLDQDDDFTWRKACNAFLKEHQTSQKKEQVETYAKNDQWGIF